MPGSRQWLLVCFKGLVAHLLLSSLRLLQEFDLVVSNLSSLHLIPREKMAFACIKIEMNQDNILVAL